MGDLAEVLGIIELGESLSFPREGRSLELAPAYQPPMQKADPAAVYHLAWKRKAQVLW